MAVPWVCRSTGGGRTWTGSETVTRPAEVPAVSPFGDIEPRPDGTLAFAAYSWHNRNRCGAYPVRSRDDGRTWAEPSLIAGDDYNETNFLRLDAGG